MIVGLVVPAPMPPPAPPVLTGDPLHGDLLTGRLGLALAATEAFGAWPRGPWGVHLYGDAAAFEAATRAPMGRSGLWIGSVLHLRPWDQLLRRDLDAILRHELTHRRLTGLCLARWQEEARCLWAEAHRRPPRAWPPEPAEPLQRRLDRALAGGTTREQAWAYRWLRAWIAGVPLPDPPEVRVPPSDPWVKEALGLEEAVTVVWPAERLTGPLAVNGRPLSHRPGHAWRFTGRVRFSKGFPVQRLEGEVRLSATRTGWRLAWTTTRLGWVAAATDGELGADAPKEAKRALAAVLARWLEGHPAQHPGGALCPLTHCAVVRRGAGEGTIQAVQTAPELPIDPRWAFFTGSAGEATLSPRAVWGQGPSESGGSAAVPGDRWARWERTLSPGQVAALKQDVRPGVSPGQAGLRLGASGPFAVEALRLAAGRRFGWTTWPSNACEAEQRPDGSLRVRGRGWGHNAGLCLATARFRAAQGRTAEQILAEAFPASWRRP